MRIVHGWRAATLCIAAVALSDCSGRPAAVSSVFTPAHATAFEAVMHFFGFRSEPEQPIAFPHNIHIKTVGLQCESCHENAAQGPAAGFPNIFVCFSCHDEPTSEEIKKLNAYFDRGETVPWRRVYGFLHEAHVRFHHAPHIRAQVECRVCHGDVDEMTVARRAVDHTMGFCVACHEERKAPNECVTCHF